MKILFIYIAVQMKVYGLLNINHFWQRMLNITKFLLNNLYSNTLMILIHFPIFQLMIILKANTNKLPIPHNSTNQYITIINNSQPIDTVSIEITINNGTIIEYN